FVLRNWCHQKGEISITHTSIPKNILLYFLEILQSIRENCRNKMNGWMEISERDHANLRESKKRIFVEKKQMAISFVNIRVLGFGNADCASEISESSSLFYLENVS
ncbi:hypothetical protein X798_07812, partial [Onchocerca flexuosa]